jgi:hypothetical protein
MSMPKMTLQAEGERGKKTGWVSNTATGCLCQRRLLERIFEQIVVFLVFVRAGVVFSDTGRGVTYAVLRMSGCTLYSFAKTKGTMPWGNAACSFRHFAKQENTR